MDRRRDNRNLQEGSYYHIYNRGNRKENIVWDDFDRAMFIQILLEISYHHKQSLICYCLMPNHFHLLLKILDTTEFVSMMRKFASNAARYYNKRNSTVGHLFQDKYKHRKIEDITDLIYTSRYIHRNPLGIDGINEGNLIEYPWSSLYSYLTPIKQTAVDSEEVLQYFTSPYSYGSFVTGNKLEQQISTFKSPKFLFDEMQQSIEQRIGTLDFNYSDSNESDSLVSDSNLSDTMNAEINTNRMENATT